MIFLISGYIVSLYLEIGGKMKITIILSAAAAVLAVTGFAGCWYFSGEKPVTAKLKVKPEGKILIVCYSQSRNQNTRKVAGWIQQQLGGDILDIETVKPYSSNYFSVLKECRKEPMPEIKKFPFKIEDYDIIFIGSPIWYGTFAPPVKTFLSQADLQGKTVVPFCTHGGSGAGTFYSDIRQAAAGAEVLDGLILRGSNIVERVIRRGTGEMESPDAVVEWLNRIFQK